MSILLLNNANVSERVKVVSCVHEMYAGDRSDAITVKIENTDGVFDKWKLQSGAEIEFKDAGTKTGKMFLYSLEPDAMYYCLRGYAMPASGTIPHTKAWERVHLFQIGEEIAKRHGLKFESYGMNDFTYEYRKQENEEDFKFYGKLCKLESAAITIYDGKLIVAYEPYLEAIAAASTIDTEGSTVECEDNSLLAYGETTISCGAYVGTFKTPDGNKRVWTPKDGIKCQSNLEAVRFAAGVLREKNKMLIIGSVEGPLMTQYAPGIMINIVNRQIPSWSGVFFLYRVRHDYGNGKTKFYFRKKLEGY